MSSPVASAAGGIVAGVGDLLAGSSEQAVYNYKANIANMNATIAKQNAIYESQTGEVQAQQQGLKTAATVAESKVGYAAGNISTTSGSASRVISSEYALGQQSQGIIRANAAKRAYGFEVEAAQDVAQAQVDVAQGTAAKTASYYQAASSILSGFGTVGSQVSAGQQSGQYASSGSSNYSG